MSTATLPTAPPRRSVARRDDLVTVATGFWLMIGLFVDGWAHVNLTELETFFTPWHGLFYSGFTATGLWMLWLVQRGRREGRSLRASVPPGYGLGLVGLAIFAVGGIGDGVWHTLFGIEVDLDALYSPTHVLLFVGMLLILTSPVRSAWQRAGETPRWPDLGAALGGATLSAAMLTFAFMYWSPMMDQFASTTMMTYARENDIGNFFLLMGMAGLFATVVILVGTLALLLRRWQLPFGAASVLFTVPSLLASALAEFHGVGLVVTALLAGLVTDLTIWRLRGHWGTPWAMRATTAVAAASLTAFYLAGIALTAGIGWAPEFTGGAVFWATALGFGIGTLVAPPPVPAHDTP